MLLHTLHPLLLQLLLNFVDLLRKQVVIFLLSTDKTTEEYKTCKMNTTPEFTLK